MTIDKQQQRLKKTAKARIEKNELEIKICQARLEAIDDFSRKIDDIFYQAMKESNDRVQKARDKYNKSQQDFYDKYGYYP